jgi:Family of unknown function (DUF6526)
VEKPYPQNFKNHARVVPPFHFFVLPVLFLNIIYSLVQLRYGVTFSSVWMVLLAVALVMLAVIGRVTALNVQDRIIHLEMQLRLERALSAELRPRIGEFSLEQLVGLRFAGDDELPVLARQVLDEKLSDRKAIKQRIRNWRPDFMRA